MPNSWSHDRKRQLPPSAGWKALSKFFDWKTWLLAGLFVVLVVVLTARSSYVNSAPVERITKLHSTILIGLDDAVTVNERYDLRFASGNTFALPALPRSIQLMKGDRPVVKCSAKSNDTSIELDQEIFQGRFYAWPRITPSPMQTEMVRYSLDCTATGLIQLDHLERKLTIPVLDAGLIDERLILVDAIDLTVQFLFAPRDDEIGRPRLRAMLEGLDMAPREIAFKREAPNIFTASIRDRTPLRTNLSVVATWRTPPLS